MIVVAKKYISVLQLFISRMPKMCAIDHFAVVCLFAWPSNENEAGGDIVLIETFLLFLEQFSNDCRK